MEVRGKDEDAESFSCIAHFETVDSDSQLIKFTDVTLAKFLSSREGWLQFQGKEHYVVAVNSLQYFDENEKCTNNTEGPLFYHKRCYQKFTDVQKLERARQEFAKKSIVLRNDNECSLTVTEETSEEGEASTSADLISYSPKKTRSTRRGSLLATKNLAGILPKTCLICKKEEIYYTCGVCFPSYIKIFMTPNHHFF